MGSKIQESARSPLIMLSSPPTSPTFNPCSSSSTKLAQIAARVVQELSGHASEDVLFPDTNAPAEQKPPTTTTEDPNHVVHEEEEEEEKHENDNDDEDDDDDEEFEFSFVCGEPDVTADEIFHNGQIRPLYYPLFNTDLLLESPPPPQEARKRLPLGKLFLREEMDRETASSASCSSSEADELEGVPSGSYCVWNPNERKKTAASSLPGMRKKSNSMGSVSKRWKLKDLLLRRSSSEGKQKQEDDINSHGKNDNTYLVLFTTTTRHDQGKKKKTGGGGLGGRPVVQSVEAKELGSGDKRRSYLPYRQDFVGLFSNVNGLSRNLHPF